MPLIMDGRVTHQSIAATRMDIGTDVNFGSITRAMFKYLGQLDGVTIYTNHQVEDIYKNEERMKSGDTRVDSTLGKDKQSGLQLHGEATTW